jgi:hypothetical protein
VVIASETRRLVGELFECAELAPLITVWIIVPTNGDSLFAPILCRV